MPRPQRHDPENGWHHVMNRGANRQDVFLSDSDRVEFGQRLDDIHDRFAIDVHAYCLMGNHYHLLVHCPEGGLSAAMQRLGSMYTRHVNDRLGRDGPLFRGRFHSRVITDPAYLIAACRYIHRNPLDFGGHVDVGRYRWSSHRTYLGHRKQPPWLTTATVLAVFGGDVTAFDRYVRRSVGVATPPDDVAGVRRLHDALRMIVTELAGSDGCEVRSWTRSGVLAVAADLDAQGRRPFATFYGIESSCALRAACVRARRRVADSPLLRTALARADELTMRCTSGAVAA